MYRYMLSRDGHDLDLQDQIVILKIKIVIWSWSRSWSDLDQDRDLILIFKITSFVWSWRSRSLSFLNVAKGKHRRGQVMWYSEAISWLLLGMESKLEWRIMKGAEWSLKTFFWFTVYHLQCQCHKIDIQCQVKEFCSWQAGWPCGKRVWL